MTNYFCYCMHTSLSQCITTLNRQVKNLKVACPVVMEQTCPNPDTDLFTKYQLCLRSGDISQGKESCIYAGQGTALVPLYVVWSQMKKALLP